MSFQNASANVPTPSSSLLVDGSNINERLLEIHDRLIKIGDMLHGVRPREAPAETKALESAPTLRRNLDRTQSCLTDIESEIARIEGRL